MTDNPMADVRQRARLAWRILRDRTTMHVPPGHPYSPIPSAADVARASATEGPGEREIPGVDLDDERQWELLDRLLPRYAETADFLTDGATGRFTLQNTWFAGADAVLYALMLREIAPTAVVEVGSGYSSALGLDVDAAFLGGTTSFTFIEPDPARLRSLVPASDLRGRLLACPVQEVAPDLLTGLAPGDVLAIDSSHVMRAGSDVQFLLFEVVPRLRPGVWIHIHDIFHPFEYPGTWLRSGTALSEAYAWRTLLQDNSRVRVRLWNHYLMRFHRDWFAEHMPLCLSAPFVTGGLWVQVAGDDK